MSDAPRLSASSPDHSSPALPALARPALMRLALPLYLGGLAIWMLAYTLRRRTDDPWLVGDWLIHYAGGMVRRGLSGELLLGVSALTGIAPATASGVLQLICLAALLIGLYRLARPLPLNLPMILLLASPALLQHFIHNPNGGLYKEILLMALLAPFCARLALDPRPVRDGERLLLAVVLALLALCHEMLFAYMPFVVIAMRLAPQAPTVPIIRDGLILLPAALLTVWVVLMHRGDATHAAAICAALAEHAPRDCGRGDPYLGAISFLAVDTATALDFNRARTPLPVALSYAFATLLALLPFLVLHRLSNVASLLRQREPRWLALLMAGILVQVLAVNIVAIDHGRFVNILVTGMTLSTLVALHGLGDRLQFRRPRLSLRLVTGLALLFVLGWKMKFVDMGPDKLFWWSKWLLPHH